ncbi:MULTISPECIES: hypothetical protein [Saccharothrix]|uniref:hypothetical protein n=1 Tax=Saccharothrix TaxID=2071 RepID=UPI00093A346F|nr:hypothetical protein [Saccharothrix sp. CB00851]OKI38871.1 hypothetical protein A6A25_01320 [Saccharothrix sp. CB00851]
MVIHTAWAHGTRDEILAELEKASGGQRSEKKQAELAAAIAALNEGAPLVKVGPIRYVVRGEASDAAAAFVAVMNSEGR